MSSDDGEFEISDWVSLTRISEDGAKKLEKFSITDLATLKLFRETDVEALKLTLADSLRFRDGINRLHKVSDVPPPLLDDKGNPLASPVYKAQATLDNATDPDAKAYSLREVERLLAGKEALAAASGVVQKPASSGTLTGASSGASSSVSGISALSALLAGSSSAVPNPSSVLASLASLLAPSTASSSNEIRDLMRDLLNVDSSTTNSRGEKALLPINFLSCVRGSQDSDEVIHSGKGLNLVLQASNKRVSPEKLTVGQWVGANSRILEKLISSGKLSPSQITDYLVYNRKIGDLLQLFTPGSVFLLDHNHRLEVNENDSTRWCDVDATLQDVHLTKRNPVQSENAASKYASTSSRRHGRRGVCWAYNTSEGCPNTRDRCKYEHSDSGERTSRSSGNTERAPRFQKGAAPV
jgi:hypothetical protein